MFMMGNIVPLIKSVLYKMEVADTGLVSHVNRSSHVLA